jgi:hypothetical protein
MAEGGIAITQAIEDLAAVEPVGPRHDPAL